MCGTRISEPYCAPSHVLQLSSTRAPSTPTLRVRHVPSCFPQLIHLDVILVGSYQNLFQWDWTLDGAGARAVRGPQRIHEGIVGALATSTRAHQLASVSHDGAVKLWSTTA